MPYPKPNYLPTELHLFWTEVDGWGVIHPDLPGVSAFGDSPEGALREYRLVWDTVKSEIGDESGRSLYEILGDENRQKKMGAVRDVLDQNLEVLRSIMNTQERINKQNDAVLLRVVNVLRQAADILVAIDEAPLNDV